MRALIILVVVLALALVLWIWSIRRARARRAWTQAVNDARWEVETVDLVGGGIKVVLRKTTALHGEPLVLLVVPVGDPIPPGPQQEMLVLDRKGDALAQAAWRNSAGST